MNIQEQITNEITQNLSNKFDEIILEGLKLKGFEFENRYEIEAFIKLNCRCEDNIQHQQKIFYVKNIPFLLHNYEVVYEPITEPFKISANCGYYKFL